MIIFAWFEQFLLIKSEFQVETEKYILMVPRGPKLDRKTSCNPRAAFMLSCSVCPRLATSEFGFTS
jgi:hypothetical protein